MMKQHSTKIGRPTLCTPENCDEIIERLTNGETLTGICRDKHLPARTTILLYRNKNPRFADRYARARRDQMDVWSDEIIDISDDGTTDYVIKKGRNGVEYEAVDQEHIQRSRLRVDTRKFLMAKIAPHVYGDHVEVKHSGDVTVQHEISDRECMRRMALFLLEDQAGGALIEGVATEAEPEVQSDPEIDD